MSNLDPGTQFIVDRIRALSFNPASDPALNYITVRGIRSPGRARLSGGALRHKWEILPAYGMSGAQMIFRGREPSDLTVDIDLWLPEHWRAWPSFRLVLEPPSDVKPLVIEVGNPLISMQGLRKAMCIREVGMPMKQQNGIWTAQLQFTEYFPFKPAAVRPKGAFPEVSKTIVTPQTETQRELAQAQADFVRDRNAAR